MQVGGAWRAKSNTAHPAGRNEPKFLSPDGATCRAIFIFYENWFLGFFIEIDFWPEMKKRIQRIFWFDYFLDIFVLFLFYIIFAKQ